MTLLSSNNKPDIDFLASNIDEIIRVFTKMFETIFQDGINFAVDSDSYKDIFEPVKALC